MRRARALAFGAPSLAALLATLADPAIALADEGGASIWIPGQFSSFASEPGLPGWSFETTGYISGVRQKANLAAARAGARVNGRVEFADYVYATPGYTFFTPVLGGQLALSATFSYGWDEVTATAVVTRRNGRTTDTALTELAWGVSDSSPQASLKWQFGAHNVMAYVTGNVPTGYYNPDTLAGVAAGHWAVDGGFGYTYDKNGLEFSVTAGATYNFYNFNTLYQSGVDGHVEVGTSWMIADPFYIGAVGYLYNQLTPDIGAPVDLGPHISRVAGAGGQFGWSFVTGNVAVSVNLRGYGEFASQNRPEGWNAWLTVSLSQAQKKSDK